MTTPALRVIGGAVCTSISAPLVKLADTSAGTAAFLRCALALVVLVPMTVAECRRVGARPVRLVLSDVAAGALLGVDYVLWAHSIGDVGASIATVLINVQVVVFPLLAWAVSRVRPSGRFLLTVPVMLAGVALASGAIGDPEPGSDPVPGLVFGAAAGVAFAGYLFLIRLGGGRDHTVFPVCASTAAAAVAAAALGVPWTGVDLAPGWPAWGWLVAMALFGQVLAWLLITAALPRLTPSAGATLLLLQPVLAVLFGMGIGERPTGTQFAGCAVVILTVWYTSSRRRSGVSGAGGTARVPGKSATDA